MYTHHTRDSFPPLSFTHELPPFNYSRTPGNKDVLRWIFEGHHQGSNPFPPLARPDAIPPARTSVRTAASMPYSPRLLGKPTLAPRVASSPLTRLPL